MANTANMTNETLRLAIEGLNGVPTFKSAPEIPKAANDNYESAEIVRLEAVKISQKANEIIEGRFSNLIGKEMAHGEIVGILEQIAAVLNSDISPERTEMILRNIEAFRKIIISKNNENLRLVEDKIVEIVSDFAYKTFLEISNAA
jgi:hypothetical protein